MSPAGEAARYAVYFAPDAAHPLWQTGCDWLGRDATDEQDDRPAPPQRSEPWRYGFHATLKPPMRLRPGLEEAELDPALQALAAGFAAFQMPRLQVDMLTDFVALRPASPLARTHPLWRLADACVTALDHFRAPPTEAELARRLRQPLQPDDRARLEAWGYPQVLEGWRFHMTLSDPLPTSAQAAVLRAAREHFAKALAGPALRCLDLCLFKQGGPARPFVLKRRYRLAH